MDRNDGLERIDEGLHTVVGDFGRSPLRRRMTLAVLSGGGVVAHSVIRMEEDGMARLDALGPVSIIAVPSAFHTSDAPWYAERYPKARVLVPASARDKLSARMRCDGTLENDWPEEVSPQLACLPIGGARNAESVFLHRPTRTLILTDLCFNLRGEYTGLARMLLRLNGALDGFGPTRLLRWVFVKDWTDLLASLRLVLEWDFDRIVVNHGEIVPTGGHALFREAFAPYGL